MLSPAFTHMSTMQWSSMPSDTNGIESLNKCSIDHSKRSKSIESCLEFTYTQDKKNNSGTSVCIQWASVVISACDTGDMQGEGKTTEQGKA